MGTPLGTLYGPSCNFDDLLSILASLCQTPAHPPAATAAVRSVLFFYGYVSPSQEVVGAINAHNNVQCSGESLATSVILLSSDSDATTVLMPSVSSTFVFSAFRMSAVISNVSLSSKDENFSGCLKCLNLRPRQMVKGKAVATAEDEDMDMEDVGRKGAAEGPERMRRNGKLCQKGGCLIPPVFSLRLLTALLQVWKRLWIGGTR
jgi:hypothetical protein